MLRLLGKVLLAIPAGIVIGLGLAAGLAVLGGAIAIIVIIIIAAGGG